MTTDNCSSPNAQSREIAQLVETAELEGEADQYTGKRDSLRFAVGMLLDVTPDTDNPSATIPVTMHNVSEGGFAFWAKQKMLPGQAICVREFSENNSNVWLPAQVTHCTSGIRGFLVGAFFDRPLGEAESSAADLPE